MEESEVTNVSLEDLEPEMGEFEIKELGKKFRLRPVSVRDEVWLFKRFGYGLQEVFDKMRLIQLVEFAFHQLVEEDKKFFEKQTVTFMNEEGVQEKVDIGGAELMMHYVCGPPEKLAISSALLKTLGFSRPAIDKMAAEEAKKKAKRDVIMETIRNHRPTGHSSSTSSPTSTDGQPSTSSPEHSENSPGEQRQQTSG